MTYHPISPVNNILFNNFMADVLEDAPSSAKKALSREAEKQSKKDVMQIMLRRQKRVIDRIREDQGGTTNPKFNVDAYIPSLKSF